MEREDSNMSFNGDLYPTAGADVVMTTKGDVVRFDSERERYGIGSTGQVMAVSSGLPAWTTISTADSVLTTQGDVLYEGAAGLARLGQSTDGFVLTTKGASANPVWAAAGGGKLELVENYTEASATGSTKTFTVTEDPDDFSCLVLEFSISSSASLDLLLQINGSVGAGEYEWNGTLIDGGSESLLNATGTASEICPSEILSSDGHTGCGRVSIYLPEAGTTRRVMNVEASGQNTSAYFRTSSCNFVASATITSITVLTSTSTWKQDSNFTLYRMAK